ncbi:MAG TPA: hypothetical protein VIU40_09290 [Geobacteraceae bacterium]
MSNFRNSQPKTGHSIIASLLSSVFFLLCLTSNVALASGEGSTSAPVLIGVDAPHQGSVDGIYPSAYRSYYHFRTNEAGGYGIRLTNTHSNFGFNLYTSQFASLVNDNGYDSTELTPNGDKTCVYNLAADTDYSIDVTDWDFVADSYTITVNNVKSEGSPGAPVPIADGASHAGMVDAASSSYYSFTPASSGAYTLAITDPNYSGHDKFINFTPLQIDTYVGADFATGLLRTCTPYYGAIYCTVNGLTQGVPVYIKISENYAIYYDTIFTVTPSKGIGEGSAANPVALAVGTPHAGGVDAGSNLSSPWCQNPSYSYYTFNTAAGSGGYTVTTDNADTDSVRVQLFHSFSDAYIASCDSSQGKPCMFSNIDPDSNYYLRVTNCNNAIVNYNILVNKEGSEGSVNNPVHLTLETSHVGAIGYYQTSYFTFTTDRSGTYTIVLDQALSWAYTSSPDFTGTGNSYGGTTINLDANRTYYLRVSNFGSPGVMQLYTVRVTHGASEGSIANPVSVPVGAPYSGKVGSQGRSYYAFTTRGAADYYVKFDNPTDLWVSGYTNPNFTNGAITTACPGPGPYVACTFENLAASTPYYVETEERAGVNAFYNIYIYVLDRLAGCSAGSECYDFENGSTTPFTLTSTVSKGNVSQSLWKIDTTNNAATGGTKSLKSGTLSYSSTNPQSTCFAYTRAPSAHSVLFSVLVTAPAYNGVEFSIDGTVQPNGTFTTWPTPTWKRVMFFPTPGQHTYKWCFNEDYPYATTPDSAWVDDIEFTNPLVLVNGLGSSFSTIQDAYISAVANAIASPVLKAQAVTFDGPFTFDSAVDTTFQGGLDPTFASVTGYSYLNGIVTIVTGSLTAENMVIR